MASYPLRLKKETKYKVSPYYFKCLTEKDCKPKQYNDISRNEIYFYPITNFKSQVLIESSKSGNVRSINTDSNHKLCKLTVRSPLDEMRDY